MFRNQNLPSRRNNERGMSSFGDFSELFDRYARDFFSGALSPFDSDQEGRFLPKIEVKENERSYSVCAELPGLKEDDINVTLKENTLIIQGEKKSESKEEDKDKGFFRSEFQYGSFYRAIPLESDVDEKKVEASYKNGLLKITLNKTGEGKEKTLKIPVKH